ncbi:MAG: hypothetical protein KDA93_07115 [Planctomycetaceae bacterium]|nr:hypothetical protein [Planctomycetaceae bacterium]
MTAIQEPPPGQLPPPPVMKVTSYDRVSSFMMALVAALVISVLIVIAIWYVRRPPPQSELVPLEMLQVSGGFEDGNPDDTWDLQSPDPEDPNATVEEEAEEVSVEEVLENVVDLSDQATEQLEQVVANSAANSGKVGSATGTGGRPLGNGPGAGGVSREQRWFIRFGQDASLDEYARQLDFFGIELGVLQPEGQIIYVSNFSSSPKKRTADSGKGENRLYMTWQSGERRASDEALLKKAGVPATRQSIIFHFYPLKTEQQLASIEYNYRKRPAAEIRRTYFMAKKQGSGYIFDVTRQTYLR